MKRLILAFLALLPIASHAGIALVQSKTAHGTSVTSEAITLSSAVSLHDVVGVFIATTYGSGQCSPAPSSVTDTGSDTPVAATTWKVNTGNWCGGVYYFVVGTGCGTASCFSITVNFASATTINLIAFDYSGVNTSTPLDGSATAWSSGVGTSASTASLTPTQTGDQQLAFVLGGTSPTYSGWSGALVQEQYLANGGIGSALADANLSSTSAVTASVTLSGSDPWGMAQLLFRPASGGGSCTHAGYTKNGSSSVPNGTSGSYWGKAGNWITPDCSTVLYWSQPAGNFVLN